MILRKYMKRSLNMNEFMLNHIEYLLDPDENNFTKILVKEGVLQADGNVNLDKVNLMAGAAASPLFDLICESELDIQEFYDYFISLVEAGEYKAAYLFLFALYEALDMELPYLFLAISGHKEALVRYIIGFAKDINECFEDNN
jgi:hypothetical protein